MYQVDLCYTDKDFSTYLKIDISDISYTVSTKFGSLSYHWSYNKLYCDVKIMKKIIEDFLNLYPQYNINKYIDTSGFVCRIKLIKINH